MHALWALAPLLAFALFAYGMLFAVGLVRIPWPPLITNQRLRRELAAAQRASRIAREELQRYTAAYAAARGATAFKTETAKFKPACLDLLQLTAPITRQQVKNRFAELAKKFHPDMKGGNAATFIRIKTARDEAFKLCKE